MFADQMVLDCPQAYETGPEIEVLTRLLSFTAVRVVELGCGRAWLTRALAQRFPDSQFIATEVDEQQHRKNLLESLPNLQFRLEGAQAVGQVDASVDIVLMLKSLHHVPKPLMGKAMDEIYRILKPGGYAYFSEPVYQGDFNALMSLIDDEKRVREHAFAAIRSLAQHEGMRFHKQVFLNVPGCYDSWEQFEARFLKVTHTPRDIDKAKYIQIKETFMTHMGEDGAHFLKPHRIDLIQKRSVS
jgi:SAM-dependent methyltransferase